MKISQFIILAIISFFLASCATSTHGHKSGQKNFAKEFHGLPPRI